MVDNLQDLVQAVNPLSMKLSEHFIMLMVESDPEFGNLSPGGTKVVAVPPIGDPFALLPFCAVAKIPQGVSLGADIEDKNPSWR